MLLVTVKEDNFKYSNTRMRSSKCSNNVEYKYKVSKKLLRLTGIQKMKN